MINLNPSEKIYLVKRRHRFVLMAELFPEIFIFFLIIIGMIISPFIFSPTWPEIILKIFPGVAEINLNYLLYFFYSLALLIFWLLIFLTFTNYYLDYWIVTNQRTIYTELQGLFNRVFSSISHDKIQDITVEVRGIFPTIFHYGDIKIQTAGEFREFIFEQIPDPYKTKEIILEAKREFLNQ